MNVAKKLQRAGMNSSKKNSYKFQLSCEQKASDLQYDTKEWIELQNQLEHTSSDYKIFTGLLEKKKHIAVKVGISSNLKNEYDVGKSLHACKNFIGFYCIFHCTNDIKNVNVGKSLCKSAGNTLGILVMPFYELGRIDKYKWTRENFDVLKSVLKHTICSLLYAFEQTGFVHRDTHLGNILLKKTTKKSIMYTKDNIEISIHSMLPVIMDFDRYVLNKDEVAVKQVYLDIQRIVSLVRSELDIKINNTEIMSALTRYISKQTLVTKDVYQTLCSLIDSFQIDFVVSEMNLPW